MGANYVDSNDGEKGNNYPRPLDIQNEEVKRSEARRRLHIPVPRMKLDL
jgi:hypothetical protein